MVEWTCKAARHSSAIAMIFPGRLRRHNRVPGISASGEVVRPANHLAQITCMVGISTRMSEADRCVSVCS